MLNNIPEVRREIDRAMGNLEKGARLARDAMMSRLIQLAQEQIKGDRSNVGYPATPGQPPMNVTGNLRRSIRGEKFRIGFATYTAVVGPTIVYGRSVELGDPYNPPSWRNGQNFPYMKPAFDEYKKEHAAILRKYIKLRG